VTLSRHLTWDNFNATVFVHGQQRVHRVVDNPNIEVFGDGVTNRLGIWIAVPPETMIPPELSKLSRIRVQVFDRDGRKYLEVATFSSSGDRHFYDLIVAIAERVVATGSTAVDAVRMELRCFEDLLEEKPLLGIERQIGLLGELIFLDHLIKKGGLGLAEAWTGPHGEPHDFRVKNREFEVKATVAPRRVHTINGSEQLVPSKDCALYLVSVLLGPAGSSTGFTLAQFVESLVTSLASSPARFDDSLLRSGYKHADSEHYGKKFTLRRPIGLVAVDNKFPAITRPTIQSALGALSQRVGHVQYEVDIDGLESEEGTQKFSEAIAL
jgi:hypothetical protein